MIQSKYNLEKVMIRTLLLAVTFVISAQASAGYLGLRVQNLPEHVRAHMPDGIAKDQGVIVDWLEDISPAADDGIKLYDVLLSFDGQAIKTAELFFQKIEQAQSEKKSNIELLRQGKVLSVAVTVSQPSQTEKMTPAPKHALLHKHNPSSKYIQQAPPLPSQPAANGPRNIAGKPAYPMRKKPEVHAWGKERNIWPDFYTDGTSEIWDSMINGPFKMGRMPGGWRAPSLSMPDPVTIGDAVGNQMPPMAEEMGNMIDIPD